MTNEREVYWLHVTDEGEEQHSMFPPKGLRCLRVEILQTDEDAVCERTFTNNHPLTGQPIEPRCGLNQDRWLLDRYGPEDDPNSTPWIRERQK